MAYEATTATIETAKKKDFVTDLQRDVSNLVGAFERIKKISETWSNRPLWADGQTYQLVNDETLHANISAEEAINAISSINTLITSFNGQEVNLSPLLYPDS